MPEPSAHSAIRSLKRILVVEDDGPLCAALARVARGWGAETYEAHTLNEGRALMAHAPELVIADLWLEGECALGYVEELARFRPAPAILAISGRASPEESFKLGQLGVRAFLPKPLFLDRLVEKVEEALQHRPDPEIFVPPLVGKHSLKEVLDVVRRVMLEQALSMARGSRSGAARLIGVTRQAIQQVFQRRRTHDDDDVGQEPPARRS